MANLRSDFYGTAGKYFFTKLGCLLLSIIPFIGLPNALCILNRYEINNTRIVGMKLEFTGKAGDLFVNIIKWGFFTLITIGLYGIFVAPVRYRQWVARNTVFAPVDMTRRLPA